MAEITKIQLKTKTSENTALWLKADKRCTCNIGSCEISVSTQWQRAEVAYRTDLKITDIDPADAKINYYIGLTAPEENEVGTLYNSNATLPTFGKLLSDIDLDLGEPLIDTNTKTVIIGNTSEGKAGGTDSDTIILGTSKNEIAVVEGSNPSKVVLVHKHAGIGQSTHYIQGAENGVNIGYSNSTLSFSLNDTIAIKELKLKDAQNDSDCIASIEYDSTKGLVFKVN